ncbi:MAG: hypothetical protein ACI9HK_006168, partial [Pirellulaceae bacterium]
GSIRLGEIQDSAIAKLSDRKTQEKDHHDG